MSRIVRMGPPRDTYIPHTCPNKPAPTSLPKRTVWECWCGKQWIIGHQGFWRRKWWKVQP